MDEYRKFILNHIICYIAKEHKGKNKESITATKLYKLLALYDFEYLRETGVPALGIDDYQAWEKGPVPISLYDEIKGWQGSNKYSVNVGYKDNVREIKNIGSPDMDYIAGRQKEILDKWLGNFEGSDTKDYIEASHGIQAWAKAWNRRGEGRKSELMNYADEFDNNAPPDDYYAYLETK